MDQNKREALLSLVRVLSGAEVPYALIGGLALQVHQREPRTTLDIDVALISRSDIPADALREEGFRFDGRYANSENWLASDGTPLQFTDDPALHEAVRDALSVELADLSLRVISPGHLLHEKLRSGSDPARRRSKRLQDLADAQALLEDRPELAATLTAAESEILGRLPE